MLFRSQRHAEEKRLEEENSDMTKDEAQIVADEQKKTVETDSARIDKEAAECNIIAADAQKDLDIALPALEKAMAEAADSHRRFEEQMKVTLAEREQQASIRLQEMKDASEQRERDWKQLKDDMQMSNITGAEELKLEYQRRLLEKTEENERVVEQLERASQQATQAKNQADEEIGRAHV